MGQHAPIIDRMRAVRARADGRSSSPPRSTSSTSSVAEMPAQRALRAVSALMAQSASARATTGYRELLNGSRAQRAPHSADHVNVVLQRRGENPHARGGSHQGWELTDHHIIAHSKLVDALKRLTPEQKREVLVAVVPDKRKLTVEMLANVKVNVKSKNPDTELRMIWSMLVDPSFEGEIGGIRVNDIRESFFEWMGGNQFAGPNTTIRPEPTSNKDDIDTDGEFFTKANYGALKTQADTLYAELEKGADLDTGVLKKTLISIAAIAKNVTPTSFDPLQWVEISSVAKLEKLAASGVIKRAHITDYTYFKLSAPAQMGQFPAPYQALKAVNAGISEFEYGDGKKAPCRVGGGLVYFPYGASATVTSSATATVTLREALTTIAEAGGKTFDDVVKPAGEALTLSLDADQYKRINNSKARLTAYEGVFDTVGASDRIVVNAATLATTVTQKLPAESLKDYLVERRTAVSSWLPKALHPALSIGLPAAMEEVLSMREKQEAKKLVRLQGSRKHPVTAKSQQAVARYERQYEEAEQATIRTRTELEQARSFWGDG